MEHRLHRYIIRRSFRLQLALIAISFVLGLGLNPLMLDLQKRIINRAIGGRDMEVLIWLSAGFLGAVLANGALKYLKQNLEGVVSETMLRDLRRELQERILRFPLPHFKNTSTGQLVAMILGEVEELGGYFGIALSTPAFNGAMLLGTIGFMVFSNPWMAAMSMVLFPVQMFFIRKLQRRVSQLSRERVRMVRGLSDGIQETVGGIQEIYANDTMAYEARGFARRLQRIFKVRLRIYNLKYLIKWINNFLEKFGQFLLLLVGGWAIINHPEAFNLGALVAFLQAYGQLNEPWRELINYFQQRETAKVKYEQVIASFDPAGLRAPFDRDEAPLPEGAALGGAYDLRAASVVLDGTTAVLDRIELTIAAAQHVAVVGTAGSGKSTLALVLAKLAPFTGTVLLDGQDLAEVPSGLAGRAIAYVGSDARLFTGTVFENLVYGLRHRAAETGTPHRDGHGERDDGWLDPRPLGVGDRAGLMAAVLDMARLVELDGDLFAFGIRSRIDPEKKPEIAARILEGRRLVIERFAGEGGEAAVEFFDRDRFSAYASIGENILFGHSPRHEMALDRLATLPHFRQVIAAVDLEEPLLALGAVVAREMVEIFADISADNELFSTFSLVTAAELPEYRQLVSRLERTAPSALPPAARDQLTTLALRLIPARHRLGNIDDALMAKVVTARHQFAETLPPALAARFEPYDRERYFADGTLLENLLFGKVVATSSLAVKRVNAIVEEVIVRHGLREVVTASGLDHHVGLFGGRLSPAQRQRVALGRALLKRPQVLVLDGALSPLEAAERLPLHQKVLEVMKDRTVVAVVERPDLARLYEVVVVLDAGRVVETGSYQKLAGRDTLFRRLATQSGVRLEGE